VEDQTIDLTLLEKTARLIKESHLAVIFSGAGISTPSGIPDFRSQRTGLWEFDNPMEVASLTSFHKTPERFFNWLRPLAESMTKASPNPAHLAVAAMEKSGLLKAVITQNIDNLHQAAGSEHVLELHGSLKTCTCSICHKTQDTDLFLTPFVESGIIPHCSACGGLMKPDIVLFEELLPMQVWDEANTWSQSCDLIIVAGSSLEVIPASTIPMQAVRAGARLIILNRTPTHLDDQASLIIRQDLVTVLPAIWERLK